MENRDLNLTVGVGLQLEKIGDGTRYVIELLGYRVGDGVIISPPYDQKEQIPLEVGDEVMIRNLGGSRQFSFNSRVSHIMAEPYQHVHLNYPNDIDATMMRRDVRISVNESVTHMALDKMARPFEIEMKNISIRGAKLVAYVQLGTVDEGFNIEMPNLTEDQSRIVTLECVIRHVRERVENGESEYHHGVEFTNLGTLERDYIAYFIAQQAEKA